jgi:Methyl-viologen-reducing hydrogenase, delta subunit
MTVKRVTFVQELLSFVGLKGRVHLEWISSAEAQKFVQVVTDFTEKIKSLGPNPLTGFTFGKPAADPDLLAQWEALQTNAMEPRGLNRDKYGLDKGGLYAGHGKKVA